MIKKLVFLCIFIFSLNCSESFNKSVENHHIIDILDNPDFDFSQYNLMHTRDFKRPIKFIAVTNDAKYVCVIHGPKITDSYNMLTILDMHDYHPAYISTELKKLIPSNTEITIHCKSKNWIFRLQPKKKLTLLTNWVIQADENLLQIYDKEYPDVLVNSLYGHTDVITSISCTPGGAVIVSGSLDGTVKFWGIKQ